MLAMQGWEDCTRGLHKSWFPGPYLQCKSERIAWEMLTNLGFLDHSHNASMRGLHERCEQIVVSRTMVAIQECDNCTRGVNKSWFPGPYSQCKNERIAREVLTNHGMQDHSRNARGRALHKRCWHIVVSRTILAVQKMRELHEKCQQIMVSRTMLAMHE